MIIFKRTTFSYQSLSICYRHWYKLWFMLGCKRVDSSFFIDLKATFSNQSLSIWYQHWYKLWFMLVCKRVDSSFFIDLKALTHPLYRYKDSFRCCKKTSPHFVNCRCPHLSIFIPYIHHSPWLQNYTHSSFTMVATVWEYKLVGLKFFRDCIRIICFYWMGQDIITNERSTNITKLSLYVKSGNGIHL